MPTIDPPVDARAASAHLLRSARLFTVLAVLAALAAVAGGPGPRPLDVAAAGLAGALAVYAYRVVRTVRGAAESR
ncbi:MAG TPA: hypothetical protein VGD91_21225 [Trebonia sp.]